jgi:hypothetical protein
MRTFEINGISVLMAYNWHISDVINSRSVFDGTVVDKQNLSAIETGQEIIVFTEEQLGNARDIGDGTFTRTSNATMQNGTNVTANVTRYETGQYGQAVMIEEGTSNLLTANQSDVETDTTGFVVNATGTTLTKDTTEHWQGSASLKSACDGAYNGQGWYTNPLTSVSASLTYTVSIWVKGSGNLTLYLYEYTAASAFVDVAILNFTATSAWARHSVTRIFGASGVNARIALVTNGAQAITFYADGLQLEAKSYATSWIQGGTTRAAETLTIPTADVWNDDEWSVELFYTPKIDTATYRTLFIVYINANNFCQVVVNTSGKLYAEVRSGGTLYTRTDTVALSIDQTYRIAVTGNGSVLRLFKNGVQVGSDLPYVKMVGSIPAIAYIGNFNNTLHVDGLIDDLRISNIARTDVEILANYNSGIPLPIDQHTTAKMAFDGTLEIFARPVIFAGTIDAPEAIESDPGYLYYPITAVDYNQIADKRLYAASHVNQLAGNIVSAIISSKLSEEGITAGSIENGPIISKANFNYKKCSEALDYLKDVTGMNWNINFSKQLNFFSNSTNLAPWILNDNVQHTNFRIKKNRSQYRNRQYVRAGTGKTTSQALEKPSPKPDGSSRSFVLRFPVAEKPVIYVNSTAVLSVNVGVNGLDTNKSWYFSYDSNIISQASTTAVLTSGTTLEITYTGLYPIIMLVDDPAQIATRAASETGTSGIYENLHTEKSINERSQAVEYAEGLILRYGIIPSTITFDTEVPGLQAGQLLPIQKTLFGINSSYLIESVDISAVDAEKTNYSIKCLDGSALGGWEQFFKDLLKSSQEYIIQENEVIVLLNVQTETEKWGSETTITIIDKALSGDSWSYIQRLGTETYVNSLAYLGSGIIIAGTGVTGQIYKSTDYGTTWNLIQQLGTAIQVYSFSYLGSGIVLAGTYPPGQIYKSTDYGDTWNLIQQLGTETVVFSLAYLGNGIVLAGTNPTGQIYKSTDYGATWNLIQRLGTETYVNSLCYLCNGIIIAGTGTGQIYKSTDYGDTWNLIQQLGTATQVHPLAYLDNGVVIAGTGTGQIYKSTDYGTTWNLIQRLGTAINVNSLCYLCNGIIIAGTGVTGQIYKSTDYGDTWNLIQRLGTETEALSLAYLGSGIVLAGTDFTGQIYKSVATPKTEVLYD